jgi:phospholipid/cholesterol/gamma-HCH transport system substrate-binding protein
MEKQMPATNEQNLTFRIGIFALASIVLLAILITLFGGSGTLFKMQDSYSIVFDYAPGVGEGTPVRRSGVRIGQVQKVELDDKTGKVRVTVRIDRPHVLYQDDQPVLVQGALSGDTSIDFVQRPAENKPAEPELQRPKVEGAQIQPVSFLVAQAAPDKQLPANPPPQRVPAKPGTEFTGVSQPNVGAILQELSKISPPAQEAFTEMQKLLLRFDKMTPLMEETLRLYRDIGSESGKMLPELRRTNDEIQVTARNWSRLGERLDVLLQTNQDKLIKTLENLNDTIVRVGSVFNDQNQRNLAATLQNVSAGTKNLESVSKNTEEFLKESRKAVERLNDSLTRADEVFKNLQQATKPMAERSSAIMKNLDEGTDKLNKTLTDVRELLRAIDKGDGTLRRILVDPSLYTNLNDAACMLARTMPRVDRILRDFEVFADKVARHPESLGVGGAISPSSGLKEGPSSWPRLPGP